MFSLEIISSVQYLFYFFLERHTGIITIQRTKIISMYNIGTELMYLKRYKKSLNYFDRGLNKAIKHLGISHQLTKNIQQSIISVNSKLESLNCLS